MASTAWDEAVQQVMDAVPVPKRRTHIWGVVETSLGLAATHGVDMTRAGWAALLHDSAKCLGHEKQTEMLKKHNLAEEPADWETPSVWHALIGAFLARQAYGIQDHGILQAIRTHPTGAPAMEDLGLILFIADYTEPSRDYEGAAEWRARALESPLVETALAICRKKIDHVRQKGRTLHPRSLRALEDLENRVRQLPETGPL